MKKLALVLAVVLSLCCFAACGKEAAPTATDGSSTTAASDVAAVQAKGKMVVGITDFAPMDYKDEGSDEWIGFDADMAKAFAEELGVEAEFIEINWDKKSMELETGAIDVVWNGMTYDDEVAAQMATGTPYCKNAQVVVVKAENNTDLSGGVDALKALSFVAENGSAGAKALEAEQIAYTAVDTQAKALMEVASGSADACVIDLLMAGAMVGEGTSYDNLKIAEGTELTSEEYVVGFRKGSDMVEAFNSFWKKAYDAGTVKATAEKYDVAQNIIPQ